MAEGLLSEAARRMSGELRAAPPGASWRGAALDSRRVAGGELFFALPGARSDGHRHAAEAVARGAAAAVVSRPPEPPVDGAVIEVADTFAALHDLTRAVRERLPEHLVAITGSVGKTTTKEILSALLARRFRVAKSPGNLNNLFGFPLALLGAPEDCQWMVAEMGMSEPGELGRISRLGRPDVVVLLNVRPAHLEAFGSLAAIAEAKAEILEGLAPGGRVVANADDPEVVRVVRRHGAETVWFGRSPEAAYTARDLTPEPPGTRFRLFLAGEEVEVRLPLHGRYNVDNFLAAATAAHTAGVAAPEIAAAAAALAAAPMRGRMASLAGGATLVDDSYNSNPEALARALESAAELPGGRRWAVLGSMLELGEASERMHREAGARAAELGFDPVIGVGAEARPLVEAARDAGAVGEWLEDAAAAAERARAELAGDDVVLVKGSRGIGLEAVVAALEGAP